jgi:hypothetical protein
MRTGRALTIVYALLAFESQPFAAEPARWQRLQNDPGCEVWNKGPQPQETVTWSGPCADGKTTGHGVLVWRFHKDGAWQSSHYEGDMQAGKPHGHGIYVWPNGDRYDGDWRDGDRQGRGVYVWADGTRYEGPFVDGRMQGVGTCTDPSGRSRRCEWSDGAFVGLLGE